MSVDGRLISVMIPAYNAASYLHEAIDSALAQTHEPLEVIVVDDGSDDGTTAVANSYGERIRFVSQPRGGNGAARNTAVTLARGRYFAFLDADDRFLPDKLERQLHALDADPELDMVFGWVREFVSPELDAATRAQIKAPAEPQAWASPNLMLIRRASFERVGLFAADLRVAVTVDWYARATEVPLKSLMLGQVVLERRLHTQNNGIRERDSQRQYIQVLKASVDRRRRLGQE